MGEECPLSGEEGDEEDRRERLETHNLRARFEREGLRADTNADHTP